jgi:nickel and cobalt resistance protein CnrR
VSGWRGLLVTVLLTLAAAFVGVWAGARYLGSDNSGGMSLHEMVHEELDLSAEQDARLDAIEADFAVERRRLELELKTANAELAAAIRAEKRNGPQVAAAIDHFHDTMGRLQKLTVEHVFAMRGVLTPAQAAEFDRTVAEALTAEAR